LAVLVITTVSVFSLQTTAGSAEDLSEWHGSTNTLPHISDLSNTSFTHCSMWNSKQASLIILISSYFTHFTN